LDTSGESHFHQYCSLKVQSGLLNDDLLDACELQVQLDVNVWFVQDQLKGDSISEVRLKFLRRLEDAVPAGED